ncbi:hypothetical protein [Cohnella luojiensis]|uniref:Uncharacterized protein n=1 Tax=Cohnella luojiensis TaxID=652876 RepID=A0A4Y8LSC1_9BACL|nr:hypothetical protein [Cohnella luojiensis]TFE23192.1 hypothetical protein E2980_19845 [Cohnella luojiensis]
MSAYEEFAREKRAVDALLQDGFVIVGTSEELEGMELRFRKRLAGSTESPEPVYAKLLLLTADARKYVSNLIFSEQQKKQA